MSSTLSQAQQIFVVQPVLLVVEHGMEQLPFAMRTFQVMKQHLAGMGWALPPKRGSSAFSGRISRENTASAGHFSSVLRLCFPQTGLFKPQVGLVKPR
ncbi:hypothetical protein [Mangrovibacterium marinum]|uniref:hypothetical protein n=1 Tax=Mangrovibacterium marinum TaxID=1639118 RepID=UPI000D30A221|nr:hypothetical protein [Mangrovibacterium marinum]